MLDSVGTSSLCGRVISVELIGILFVDMEHAGVLRQVSVISRSHAWMSDLP